jgi:hypothetical protein
MRWRLGILHKITGSFRRAFCGDRYIYICVVEVRLIGCDDFCKLIRFTVQDILFKV